MVTVSIVDETTGGGRGDAWCLEIFEERPLLREVIRRRVFQEVAEHNARPSEEFLGLVRPTDAERELNGVRERDRRRLDPERQYRRALEAFRRNGFIVLVDDEQMDDLDARAELHAGTRVTFLQLVPLAGG
jgi:hypothetical protein